MGYGVDETAINQAESRSGESCTQAQTIGAITDDQRRITSAAAHVFAVNDCDRNTLTVGRSRAELIHHIATGIKPAACRVLLAERQRPCRHIEVIDALWLQRAAEMEAQCVCSRIEIGFVLVKERARGDADYGWTWH